jgi:hypothetical protein
MIQSPKTIVFYATISLFLAVCVLLNTEEENLEGF